MLDVEKAVQELAQKSYRDIQVETAWTWASRAAASYQNCLSEEGPKRLVCWTLGEELYHESIEHAALSEDDGLVREVRDAVFPYQEKAAALIDSMVSGGSSGQA